MRCFLLKIFFKKLFYTYLFFYHRTFTHFRYKNTFYQFISITFFTKMHFHIFNTNGVAIRDVCNITMADIVSIQYYNQSTSDCFHIITARYQHAGIFSQSDTNTGWITGHSLRQPALQDDGAAWAAAWRALDAGPLAALRTELERGQPVTLTLCGDRAAQRWQPQPKGGLFAWIKRLFNRPRPAALLEAL